MARNIQCISPIDGSVYAEREPLSLAAATAAVAEAAAAQRAWEATPLQSRIERVLAGVKALGDMNAEIATELAWQMGRPVRYGGEFSGVNERANYMASIAEAALAPIEIENSRRVHPPHRAQAARCRAGGGAVELPLPHGHQHHTARAHRR
jgi:acyl-CoA reductase-like NAD-dependent aldehyde dehydrogenase